MQPMNERSRYHNRDEKDLQNVNKQDEPKFLLHRELIDKEFHDPYIITGYRQPHISALDCVKSAVVFKCNESFNILSHLGAFLYLAVKYFKVFTYELPLNEPLIYPLVCQATGILGFCAMSAIAHTFNSMSPCLRNRCFFLDYAAISIYTVGAGISFYFYERPLQAESDILTSPEIFIYLSIATSVISTYLCCQSRTRWISNKYIIRTLSYAVPFIVNSFPLFYRLATCKGDIDCDTQHFQLYMFHSKCLLLASIANVTKFPERFLPGKFDALGQSHHVMHILFPLGCDMKFEFLRSEYKSKRSIILSKHILPNFNNTIGLMLIAVVLNLAIAIFASTDPSKKEKKN